jgi:transposase-like protein
MVAELEDPYILVHEKKLSSLRRLVYLWRAVDAEGEVLDVPVQATVSL